MSYQYVKRGLDLSGALLAIILVSPLLLVLAAAIRFDSPGPALYRGVRIGLRGREFLMLKFRTMIVDADKSGVSSTAADDDRITRTGAILRRFKLDELPQLFNVLSGEMSWVGPRPQVRWAVERYSAEERRLLSIRPGITDYASLVFRAEGSILRGSSDPDGDYLVKIAPGKIRLGLHYVRTCSWSVDVRILLATALAIFGVSPIWCVPVQFRHLDPGLGRVAA